MKNRRRFKNKISDFYRFYKVDTNQFRGLASGLLEAIATGAPKGSLDATVGGARVHIDLGDLAARLQHMTRPGSSPNTPGETPSATVPPDCTHCDGPTLLQHADLPHSAELKTTGDTSAWVRPPPTAGGQEAVNAATRSLLTQATLVQDGLKMMTNHPSFQGLFEGGRLVSGATLTLPASELATLLLSHVVIAGSPQTVQTVNFAQTVLAFLAQGPAAGAQLSKLVGQMLSAGTFPGADKMLKTLSSFLGSAGLAGFQEVQQLFKSLAESAGKHFSPSEGTEVKQHQQLAQTIALCALPQMTGVAESQAGGFFQGLGQAFGSVFRGLAGLLMMNPQNQWPQALPTDQLPAELTALFAAQAKKTEREKKGKKTPKKSKSHQYPGELAEGETWEEDSQGSHPDPKEAYLEENRVFRPVKA